MSEQASAVGLALSKSVQEQRLSGHSDQQDIADLVERLCDSDVRTPLDAMAFLVFSRTILTEAILAMPPDQPGPEIQPRELSLVVLNFIGRAIGGLEAATGHGAESFSGAPDTVN